MLKDLRLRSHMAIVHWALSTEGAKVAITTPKCVRPSSTVRAATTYTQNDAQAHGMYSIS